VVAGRCC